MSGTVFGHHDDLIDAEGGKRFFGHRGELPVVVASEVFTYGIHRLAPVEDAASLVEAAGIVEASAGEFVHVVGHVSITGWSTYLPRVKKTDLHVSFTGWELLPKVFQRFFCEKTIHNSVLTEYIR